MCGIVAAVSNRNIVPTLVKGLERLEYRGYDSCGVAVHAQGLKRARSTHRVSELMEQILFEHLEGRSAIAHTRWATHGAPAVHNAHPHFSYGVGAGVSEGEENVETPAKAHAPALGQVLAENSNARPARIGVVHNGIIENYEDIRTGLEQLGYVFHSQTDTEVIAHLVDSLYEGDLFQALKLALPKLRGAYALAIFHKDEPERIVGAKSGSPLILGVGASEIFLASDAMALSGVTDQIVYLEEGDVVDVTAEKYKVEDKQRKPVERVVKTVTAHSGAAELGPYKHYMQKEIFEQPGAIADTLEGVQSVAPELFGENAEGVFKKINRVLILACGTSYYSGCVAKYWLESVAKINTQVEIASEYRYRDSVPDPNTLVVTISQSGETADTLAALKHAVSLGMEHTLTICNVSTSALVRECELAYVTRAGVEVGVASTKAFTTQLAALFLLTLCIARIKNHITLSDQERFIKEIRHLPAALQGVLALEPQVMRWSEDFVSKENALFLGRGTHYPIAMEGALKLKEITYIHAEAYAAGELKHGPLALVTSEMPVVAVAPNDALIEKLKSNLQEVRARGGVLYVLADADSKIQSAEGLHVIRMPEHYGLLSPILHVVPLQLLAYHTACGRLTDVDKPRNLAKSVTVE